ncbi:protein-tyrosine phosphatase-like protein [Dimargaris cristalligena]|uniref:Protein-tyrosine phosphatase-like protein n=1 Tax=Dimargaris cristalligena TaxID=215637 RepID=A0A4P9ZSD0_9FUNG|nr:protein-tyrosine phosphatase-like protein [Dimargaris cristalligena]|eukprot:RKP36454.1 protein-tyrosine phosphatase-like protein [Dimargaris cristalligena]
MAATVLQEADLQYAFENISNFRDVACSVSESLRQRNPTGDGLGIPILPRLLFRSARPDRASEVDLEQITKRIGIKTIVDLRSDLECHNNEECACSDSRMSSSVGSLATWSTDVSPMAPVQHQKRLNINLIGPRFRYGFVFGSAGWITRSKICYYQLRGMRREVLETVGREVFQDIGLPGFYSGLLRYSGKEITRAIKPFSYRENYPILVHCSHGKDRTGIIVALLLSLLGVDDELIIDDYTKTREGMRSQIEEMKRDMQGTGMPEEFIDAPPEAMRMTIQFMREQYKTPARYLRSIGISKRRQARIIQNLTTLNHTA